jgi:SAM-dependent methyltransferase
MPPILPSTEPQTARHQLLGAKDDKTLSWRDPDGFVVRFGTRILRAVSLDKAAQTVELLGSSWMTELMTEGVIPKTVVLADPPQAMEHPGRWLWLEHEVLAFPCFPHEITALQLFDAGLLTLQIALKAAEHGWVLKDASAWNVLYSQGRPVFVDLLSFEKQQSARAWIAYGQFARHFLLPLMLYRHVAMTPSEVFLANRDGIPPERAYELLSGFSLLSASALEFVVLPKMLAPAGGRRIAAAHAHKPKIRDPALAKSLLLSTLRRLQRRVERLRPDSSQSSVWKEYEENRAHYSDADLTAKTDFVKRHLEGSSTILDLGCNAGEFSLIAAAGGKTVVAADADHAAVSRLYTRIRGKSSGIAPLILNIGRPTPPIGWLNSEVPSFLERSAGYFDCLLVLGLLHHLLVTERATLPMVANLLDGFGSKQLILEWVDPADEKFRQLVGLNGDLYASLTTGVMEDCFRQNFVLREKIVLPCGTRVMYSWVR